MTTINTNLSYNKISNLFDDKKFYVKIFKDLLNAAITDDFSELSRTSNEIKNKYNEIHNKVLNFFKDHIYERLYTSNAYDGLMYALVDIYSVMYTIVDLRGNITEISIQPDQVVDAYLDSFGFPCKELFNYIQKREICKVIYWYLRRKGTPQLIIKILNTLGFSYFFISEFQLTESENSSLNINKHQYTSRLIYEENNGTNTIGFYSDTSYNYDEVRAYDPLNIKSDDELSNDELITFPSQSSYYQMGIAVTYPELERQISSFTYAMIKKTYHDQSLGENVFTSKVTDYNKNVSFISLILGYTYIMGEYFNVYDNTNLFKQINVEDYYNEETFDPDNITTKIYTKDGQDYDLESYFGYNLDGSKIDYNEDAYINEIPVVGWNKNIYDSTPYEIMHDIDEEIKRLNVLLKYQPNTKMEQVINQNDKITETVYDNIYNRKKEKLKEIKEIFYSAPIFISYQNAIDKFIEHDNNFKKYIDSILLTEDERVNLQDESEIERNVNNVLELLNNILESIEYYIFDNTTYIIPVKNFIMSYSKTSEILKKIDKYFTPWHSKLLYPLIVWMIKDLPGDIVALNDSIVNTEYNDRIFEPYWIADGYEIYDDKLPNSYAPMYDWKNKSYNPHIPYSLNYLDDPIYDRWKIQKYNPFLFVVGYDWRYLTENPLIVQNREYELKYDWEPDKVEINNDIICTSAFDISRPDHNKIKLINELNEYINSKKVYLKTYKEIITIKENISSYVITHNFKSKDIFVTIYDVETGEDVNVDIIISTINNILINFKYIENNKKYKVIICCPSLEEQDYQNISGLSFNLINNSYINNYLLYLPNEYLYDCYIGMYDKELGYKYNMRIKRSDDKKSIYLSHNKFNNNLHNKYRLNLLSVIDQNDIDKVHLNETVFESYDIDLSELEEPNIILSHKFRTNNLIIRIYDLDDNYRQVNTSIEYLNINQIKIDFSDFIESKRFKVLILATINNLNLTALPLNDIIGFSTSFKLQENVIKYNLNHNLNSYNLFEQIYDNETGELINIQTDRIDENNIQLTFNKDYVNENIGKEYSLIIFGQMDIDLVKYPSTIYNTNFETFIVKNKKESPIILNYDESSKYFNITYDNNMYYDFENYKNNKQIIYHIEHNMNNKDIVLQIYNDHNLKVDSYIQIIDENNIILVVNSPLILDEIYKINILSLPNINIKKTNYINSKQSNNFIAMYTDIISNEMSDDIIDDIDSGDESLEDDDYIEDYDGGNEDTLNDEYLDDINNGDPSIGSFDNSINTFTINHNLNTQTILVNVFNNKTKETINTYVAINDENSITIGFINEFYNIIDGDYTVVIIGALPIKKLNIKDYYDVDHNNLLQPHHYMEYKKYEDDTITKHISYDNDFYDMDNEYITSPFNIKVNIQRRDMPIIKERVDIIHEIKLDKDHIIKINENINEINGFNEYSILTNDISSDNNIKEDTGYKDTLVHLMKIEPIFLNKEGDE